MSRQYYNKGFDPESGSSIGRKKSLVKPERAKMNPSNPHYFYNKVATSEASHIGIQNSTTGANPIGDLHRTTSKKSNKQSMIHSSLNEDESDHEYFDDTEDPAAIQLQDINKSARDSLKSEYTGIEAPKNQGKEIYGLNDETGEDGASYAPYQDNFVTDEHTEQTNPLNYQGANNYENFNYNETKKIKTEASKKTMFTHIWLIYCYIITFWAPSPLLHLFGMPKKERQVAWREKIGLISIIMYLGAIVAYLIFGFSRTVCKDHSIKMRNNSVSSGYLIINGKAYDLTSSQHPAAEGINAGSNILYPPINAGGKDGSFLFQNVNGNCKGLITPRSNCSIPTSGEEVAWYMPCKLFDQDGSSPVNFTESEYYSGWACHTSDLARSNYYSLQDAIDIYFSWDDITNSSRKLVVYNGDVLDLNLLNWIQYTDLEYPVIFDKLKDDDRLIGKDISILFSSTEGKQQAKCLQEIIKVGTIDSETIGCLASDIVLYTMLAFILVLVIFKFIVACYFRWFISPKQGASVLDFKTMNKKLNEIEDWSENINSQAANIKKVDRKNRADYNSDKRQSKIFLGNKRNSRFSAMDYDYEFYNDNDNGMNDSNMDNNESHQVTTMGLQIYEKQLNNENPDLQKKLTNNENLRHSFYANSKLSQSTNTLMNPFDNVANTTRFDDNENFAETLPKSLVHPRVLTQPNPTYKPYGYPLAHTICFITCYSEDELALRTTLDSVATTDYLNSHKLIMVVCDGLIKGSGNDRYTSDIVLDMVDDFTIPREQVDSYSYVAVAQGTKRHNKAKIYSGFYKYDNDTIPIERQQRVPMIVIVKSGTEAEQGASKPGNRGKRDSQIILMSFLQKVTFNERMTRLEFEILQNIWMITGLMADMYEIVLMVDADTKIFPDSLTHMIAEMVNDPEIMGLCGETKIANKTESFTTGIQVFEYFISHHQAKAFESVFGCVTCLPGCFCMYRIKSPKGRNGFWVPILANPDIVERYSDNIVDTLHKKNLLLLGEDRYLTSLMLRTFPKRKQIFVAKASCKTVVPNKFKILLSQRRRWINSTVHNLMELVLVKDLCGTFCFSMQFVIFIELIGTLVLPCAIVFTIYVIIFAIVSKPTPILTLVLLAVIFGLPALLIAVTISRLSYFLWMLLYIIALPIWNFILPTYAYWKFDDFSWGETRKVVGDKGHEEEGGDFDATNIVMKRWDEFERDRKKQSMISAPEMSWNPITNNEQPGDYSDIKEDESGFLAVPQ